MSTIPNITFTSALGKLGMDDKSSSGIRFVADRIEEVNPDLYIALEYANEFGAKAVYFRFYNDSRPPKPQIYIYDYSDFTSDSISGADIHHKLWNAGVLAISYFH